MAKTLSFDVPGAIAGYNIISQIGEGGMARVFRGRNNDIGKEVAIKVISPYYKNDPGFKERFRREAEALTQVEHDGIVKILQWVDEEDTLAMVMELLEGDLLNDHLDSVFSRKEDSTVVKPDGLKILENIRIIRDVASAMSHVHRKGVCHRDLKPDNIFIVKGRRGVIPKIIDFGICHPYGSPRKTRVGSIIGTPGYMAPEQITQGEINNWTDIYALGIIFFEAVTGVPLFHGHPNTLDVQYQLMLNKDFVSQRIREENIQPHIAPIIRRCLRFEVKERYPFMDNMVGALDLALEQEEHYMIGRVGLLINKKSSNEIVTVEENVLQVAEEVTGVNPFDHDQSTAEVARANVKPRSKLIVIGSVGVALIATLALVYFFGFRKQSFKVANSHPEASPNGMSVSSRPISIAMRSRITLQGATASCIRVTPSIANNPRSKVKCIREKIYELYRLKNYNEALNLALAAKEKFWTKQGWRNRKLVKNQIKRIYRIMGKIYRIRAAKHARYSAAWDTISRQAAECEQIVKNWGG